MHKQHTIMIQISVRNMFKRTTYKCTFFEKSYSSSSYQQYVHINQPVSSKTVLVPPQNIHNRSSYHMSFRQLLLSTKSQTDGTKPITSMNPTAKTPKTSSYMWPILTLAVVGTTFIAGNYVSDFISGTTSSSVTSDPISPQADITSHAYFDVTIDSKPVGRIVIGLHGTIVPKTVANFEALCRGNTVMGNVSLKFVGSPFHRIIPNFMIQGGDFTRQNGTGGRSIYGTPVDGRFSDENFTLKHVGPGVVSMANSGPNTNGSQFFITTSRTSHLNGKHVVFGTITDGWDVVKLIESYGTNSGKPTAVVRISNAGLLEDENEK